ncbi:MAG: uroporphyrinogen decarboxylase, partial [Chitinophagaceae bacterium]
GRYLPQYMELRKKYTFFERCETPELAATITLQPIDIMQVDAAILFSDILVVPKAMGLEVQMIENKGPVLPNPIKSLEDMHRIAVPDVQDKLWYVFEAIKLCKQQLNNRVPLIGFAGAPWTILCYMVQGKGSKTFDEAKAFCYANPELAHRLLQMITDTTIAYLKAQTLAGADIIQVFDSWGGLLGKEDFENISYPYLQQILDALKEIVPVIIFAKGAWQSLETLSGSGAAALGIDWCITPQHARAFAGSNIVLQGNFDPAKLLAPIPTIISETKKMMAAFGSNLHIANLGHGILPNVPVDHARAFIETVKNYVH